jgi:MoxR-like ATPase
MIDIQETCRQIRESIATVIVGKDDVIELCLVALLCEGHILLEDVPGIGKTTLAKALARSLGCSFKRIQFTPDLLPGDVTGIYYFNQRSQEFEFRPGPIISRSFWLTRSIEPHPVRRARCWRPCKNDRSQ